MEETSFCGPARESEYADVGNTGGAGGARGSTRGVQNESYLYITDDEEDDVKNHTEEAYYSIVNANGRIPPNTPSQPTQSTQANQQTRQSDSSPTAIDDIEYKNFGVTTDNTTSGDSPPDKTPHNIFARANRVIARISDVISAHAGVIKNVAYAVFIAAYAAYFAYALNYEFGSESSIRLLWCTLTAAGFFFISLVRGVWGQRIETGIIEPVVVFVEGRWRFFKWSFIVVVLGLYIAFIVTVAVQEPSNLISFAGLCIYVFLMFLFSVHKRMVRWRTVIWGLGIQSLFALLVLRTTAGYDVFSWIGDRVQEYMAYTDAGAIFIFGEKYTDHFFAMKILPVVIFFSSTISVLYYLGVMQAVILKLAWIMQRTMGTTAAESVNAAGNIFIGQTEAPLLIRPFIHKMTNSELHAVMVGGYATIAGSVMATYILIGVPANHLISASIMAAPCALAISKLCYPETEESLTTGENIASMAESQEHNVVEAASAGASAAVPLVGNIAANLIAFISLLAFVNATLTWFGHRAGMFEPELTFEFLCSYILWPFAFIMGVPSVDCRKVAELIGIKTFINEFVAFTELAKIIENSEELAAYEQDYPGNWTFVNDQDIFLIQTNQTLFGGVMGHKSMVISTYALCGFANLSSIGCVIGALTAMVPSRQTDIAKLAVRAMVAGNVVCFMNACTAGLMYQSPD